MSDQLHHIFKSKSFSFCLLCKEDITNGDQSEDFSEHLCSLYHHENARNIFKQCTSDPYRNSPDEEYTNIVTKSVFDISLLLGKESSYICQRKKDYFCLMCETSVTSIKLKGKKVRRKLVRHLEKKSHLDSVSNICWVYRLNMETDFILFHKSVVYCSMCKVTLQCKEEKLLQTVVGHLHTCQSKKLSDVDKPVNLGAAIVKEEHGVGHLNTCQSKKLSDVDKPVNFGAAIVKEEHGVGHLNTCQSKKLSDIDKPVNLGAAIVKEEHGIGHLNTCQSKKLSDVDKPVNFGAAIVKEEHGIGNLHSCQSKKLSDVDKPVNIDTAIVKEERSIDCERTQPAGDVGCKFKSVSHTLKSEIKDEQENMSCPICGAFIDNFDMLSLHIEKCKAHFNCNVVLDNLEEKMDCCSTFLEMNPIQDKNWSYGHQHENYLENQEGVPDDMRCSDKGFDVGSSASSRSNNDCVFECLKKFYPVIKFNSQFIQIKNDHFFCSLCCVDFCVNSFSRRKLYSLMRSFMNHLDGEKHRINKKNDELRLKQICDKRKSSSGSTQCNDAGTNSNENSFTNHFRPTKSCRKLCANSKYVLVLKAGYYCILCSDSFPFCKDHNFTSCHLPQHFKKTQHKKMVGKQKVKNAKKRKQRLKDKTGED